MNRIVGSWVAACASIALLTVAGAAGGTFATFTAAASGGPQALTSAHVFPAVRTTVPVAMFSLATLASNAVCPWTSVSSMAMARMPITGLPQAPASTCPMPNPSSREGAAYTSHAESRKGMNCRDTRSLRNSTLS